MSGQREIAEQALALLESEAFETACRVLDESIVEKWRRSRDQAERERLHIKQEALGGVRAELFDIVSREAERRKGDEDNPFAVFVRKFISKQQE